MNRRRRERRGGDPEPLQLRLERLEREAVARIEAREAAGNEADSAPSPPRPPASPGDPLPPLPPRRETISAAKLPPVERLAAWIGWAVFSEELPLRGDYAGRAFVLWQKARWCAKLPEAEWAGNLEPLFAAVRDDDELAVEAAALVREAAAIPDVEFGTLLARAAHLVAKPGRAFRPRNKASLARLGTFDRQATLPAIPAAAAPSGQLTWAPLWSLDEVPGCESWLLDLFRRTGGKAMKPGRGAPWTLRLWVGAMLHLPQQRRDNYLHEFALPVDYVRQWLTGPGKWTNRARDWPKVQEALEGLTQLGRMSMGGYRVRMVEASGIPEHPDRPILFAVRCPAVAASGDPIHWPTLCALGRESSRLYSAYLGVTAFLGRTARAGVPLAADDPDAGYSRELTARDLAQMMGLDGDEKRRRPEAVDTFRSLAAKGHIDLREAVEPGRPRRFRIFAPPPALPL